jgi:hypothetical protein
MAIIKNYFLETHEPGFLKPLFPSIRFLKLVPLLVTPVTEMPVKIIIVTEIYNFLETLVSRNP